VSRGYIVKRNRTMRRHARHEPIHVKLEIDGANDKGTPLREAPQLLEDARKQGTIEWRIEKEDAAVELAVDDVGLLEGHANPESATGCTCRFDEVRLNLDANRRNAGQQMDEHDDAAKPRPEVDHDILRPKRDIAQHRQDLVDATRQIRHGAGRQRAIGWWSGDAEELVDPGIPSLRRYG
jgi:hypothetical protein